MTEYDINTLSLLHFLVLVIQQSLVQTMYSEGLYRKSGIQI